MKWINGLGVGSVLASGVLFGCGAPVPSEDIAEVGQRIELHDLGASYGFAFIPSAPLQAGEALTALQARLTRHSFPIQATGAVIAPYLDAAGVPVTNSGTAVRFTCGATLVSPSYAITAAHCVDSDSIKVATDTVLLELYRPTSRLALESTWRPKTQLSGTFPDFQHASYSADDGYFTDRYTCTLSARCGSGSVNCPSSATTIDVALLHCDGRPGDRYGYLDVASSERAGADVYVPWKHEVYDIAASELTTSDKYLHYVKYPAATYADNYHYLDRNQLLPLESIAWPNGAQPRKVSDVSQLTVWTDALGCHGTSGSGFLQQNLSSGAWELLGPTALAGSAFGGLLCEHLPGVASQLTPSPGQQNLAYSSVVQTQTILSGSTAAWAADCAAQPLGSFSLGSRSACSRTQSGLALAPRSAYRDLDPWLSPSLPIAGGTTAVGSVVLEAGKTYRVALGVTPQLGCSSGGACPELEVRVGNAEVLRATITASAGQTALVGALFTAGNAPGSVGSQTVSVLAPSGSFELGALEISPNSGANSFDTGYERAEAALTVPSVDPKKTLPMRFVGDGLQGFSALLYPEERLLLVRRALALQGNFSVRFTSSNPSALSCGLLDQDGSVLTSAPCLPGSSTSLSYVGSAPAAAVFIEGAPVGGVEIDNVSISLDQPVASHCIDGQLDSGESDLDCGGTCVRCSDNKNCVTAADCVSNSCTAGKCTAAPTCSDTLKNGTETDVDCGGSCTQHCAVGKTCSVAADCTSNTCNAGLCIAAPTCSDTLKNGTETDVDCGGSCTQHCAVGKACSVAADCTSNRCTAGKCVAAPTCSDALKNGSETDVDCGGSCTQHCAVGKACSVAADCASNTCTAGKCVTAPTCSDALKNGSETDVDCGGSCTQHCAVGKGCSVAADCTSNTCTAGKCVATPPGGLIATLALSSEWNVGYCANVTVTNTAATTTPSWTVTVNLAQSSVSSSWSATATTSGATLTAHSLSWNAQLAKNSSTSFGFCANKNGSNWQPKIASASSP